MRAALRDLEAFDVADLFAALGVVLVEFPSVPFARLVLPIGPELIAASRQSLATGGFVLEALDRTVAANDDPQEGVF